MKKVVVVEDHESLRKGLEFIINSSEKYECLGTAGNGMAGLELVRSLRPDVVLMDIGLPDLDGIECTRILKNEIEGLKILVCTVSEDDAKIFNVLSAGADGYILKKSSPVQIIEALDDVMAGGAPMSSLVAKKMIDFFLHRNASQNTLSSSLTDREMEILKYLAQGYRNSEISEKLFISLPTVKTHVYNIYQKLHVRSRVDAVNAYNKMGGFTSGKPE